MESLSPDIYLSAPVALGRSYAFTGSAASAGSDAFDHSVDAATEELCGQQLRQASRFIRLAAVGALRCARAAGLPAAGGLYLATGLGDQNTAARLFTQSHLSQGRASPFDFVNVNSNTASYYVGRIAGLTGPNLTVSQGVLSFEWALRLAIADIQAGLTYALVGGVDERAASGRELARRFRRGRGQPAGEGSGWLVLTRDRDKAQSRLVEMRWLSTPGAAQWRALGAHLAELAGGRMVQMAVGPGVQKRRVKMLGACLPGFSVRSYLARCGHYPTAAAFGVADGVREAAATGGLWLHVGSSPRGHIVVTVWEGLA